jgi:hypothetical protein
VPREFRPNAETPKLLRYQSLKGNSGRNALFYVRNLNDDILYRVSVIHRRKTVSYLYKGFLGTTERATVGLTAEAAVGKAGSIWSVIFPSFVVGYASTLPPKLDHDEFCNLLREMLSAADFEKIRIGVECPVAVEISKRKGLLAEAGVRLHAFTLGRVPHFIVIDRNR